MAATTNAERRKDGELCDLTEESLVDVCSCW